MKEYGRTKEAVLETIRICKNRKILKEYLESREKEVVDIMMTLFDQEYAVERYGDEKKAEGKAEGLAEGKVEGLAEGEAKGTMKAKQEMTYKLVDRRIPLETISEIVEISVEVIKKWLAERPVTVR